MERRYFWTEVVTTGCPHGKGVVKIHGGGNRDQGPVHIHYTRAMAAADGKMDGDMYASDLTPPPGIGTTMYLCK